MAEVAVFLADGFEEIEAVTIIDVLRRADVHVQTLSLKNKLVKGSHGIEITADSLLEDELGQTWDMLVLPGGQPGANTLRDDPRVTNLLIKQLGRNQYVAAICAAPIALGSHGLLKGRRATSYPGYQEQLSGVLFSEERVVIDRNVITSRGAGTALEFALELVKILRGREAAEKLHKAMLAQ